jgi:hypothetical protein
VPRPLRKPPGPRPPKTRLWHHPPKSSLCHDPPKSSLCHDPPKAVCVTTLQKQSVSRPSKLHRRLLSFAPMKHRDALPAVDAPLSASRSVLWELRFNGRRGHTCLCAPWPANSSQSSHGHYSVAWLASHRFEQCHWAWHVCLSVHGAKFLCALCSGVLNDNMLRYTINGGT